MGRILNSQTLIQTKNRFLLIAAPVEVLVSLLYGAIYIYDVRLLIPEAVDVFLPLHVDFGLHGAPAILLLIDFLCFSSNWTLNPLMTLILYANLGLGYWYVLFNCRTKHPSWVTNYFSRVWVHKTYAMNGYFPYPLLEIVSVQQRLLIFTIAILLMFSAFLTLRKIHYAIHGP